MDATIGAEGTSAVQPAVQAMLERVHAAALAADRSDLAEGLVTDWRRLSRAEAMVVVVGESQVGKTTLVNALVGIPDLLPTGAAQGSRDRICVRHGDGTALVYEGATPRQATVAEAVGLAAAKTNEAGQLHAVELFVEAPLLAAGLMLVDTPGVGGLDAAAGRVTLSTLHFADVLLFATDAGSPLSAPELQFLTAATERIETVLFALTKTDLYPGWERVLAENREKLHRHAPRYGGGEWVPTAGLLAVEAAALRAEGDVELAEEYETDSGMDGLRGLLTDGVARCQQAIRLANLCRAAISVIQTLSLRYRALATTQEHDSAQLEAQQQRWQHLSNTSSVWQRRLHDETQMLAVDFRVEVQHQLRVLSDRYEILVEQWDAQFGQRLPRDLADDLHAVAGELAAYSQRRVACILDDLETLLGNELDIAAPDVDLTVPLDGPAPRSTPKDGAQAVYRLVLPTGAVGGLAGKVGWLVAASAGTGGVGAIVALAAGGGAGLGAVLASLMERSRRKLEGQREARDTIARTISQAHAVLQAEFDRQLVSARRQIEQIVSDRVTAQLRELEAALADSRRVGSASAGPHTPQSQAAERLNELEGLRAEAERLMASAESVASGAAP